MQTSKVANTVVDVTGTIARATMTIGTTSLLRRSANFVAALQFGGVLFTTDASVDFELFLDELPHSRQYYNCHCCRQFVNHYGGLIAIDDKGKVHPACAIVLPPFRPSTWRRQRRNSEMRSPFLTSPAFSTARRKCWVRHSLLRGATWRWSRRLRCAPPA